jgi:predicted outer membrane repeat protein
MNSFPSKRKVILLSTVLLFLFLISCWELETIVQPKTADPNSTFNVPITIKLTPEEEGGKGYFGIRLPVGWTIEDNIPFSGSMNGTFIYSSDHSNSMEIFEKSPAGYYWWVSACDSVDSLGEGTITLTPRITTDDQTGIFFLDYIISDRIENFGDYVDHKEPCPITVGLPMSVTVTNTEDNGNGSLRRAMQSVGNGGEIIFDLAYPAIIKLDSQLVIDRSVSFSGPMPKSLTISGNKKDRVISVKDNLNVNISNLTLSDGYKNNNRYNVGGGIFCTKSTLNLSNVIIKNNYSKDSGGGIFCDDCDLYCNNVRIVDNMARYSAGGLSLGTYGSFMNLINVTIANNVVEGNVAATGAGITSSGRGSIINSIIWNNSSKAKPIDGHNLKVNHSNVQSGYVGEGNIDSDPVFFDMDNYYLDEHSPCIDSGNPDTLFNDYEDTNNPGKALWPALGGLRNDMGAYGGHGKFQQIIWHYLDPGLSIISIDFTDKQNGWLLGQGFSLITNNGGQTWVSVPNRWDISKIDFVNETVGWGFGENSDVYRTEDGGHTWVNLKNFRRDYSFKSMSAVDEKTMYIVATVTGTPGPCGAILKTLDGGASWIEITPDNDKWDFESVWTIDDDVCIAAGWGGSGGILKTFDGGRTWEEKKPSEFWQGISDIQFIDDSTGYVLVRDSWVLYQTRDACASWKKLVSEVTSFYALDSNTVFAAVFGDEKIMKTTDGGITWNGTPHGLGTPRIKFVDDSIGWFVGGTNNILKTMDCGETWVDQSYSLVTGIQRHNTKTVHYPERITLYQNYPNPFNPTTTIQYEIPNQSQVRIIIYNILGRKVKTLLNSNSQPGTFEIVWDGTDELQNPVAGGVYFCRMEAGAFTKTIKLALVR